MTAFTAVCAIRVGALLVGFVFEALICQCSSEDGENNSTGQGEARRSDPICAEVKQ